MSQQPWLTFCFVGIYFQVDVDIATRVNVSDDGPDRR